MLVLARAAGWAGAYLVVAATAATGLILLAGRGESIWTANFSQTPGIPGTEAHAGRSYTFIPFALGKTGC
jgi:hypothetical protein